jgi:uncharacterized integral membrane protein (TIGR00698 family)
MLSRVVFLLLLVLVVVPSPWTSPPVALVLGAAFGLTLEHPFPARSRKVARLLLQASVVLLGFSMNLEEVLSAGRSGFVYTLSGISFALALGTGLARALSVPWKAGYLVSVGTAICGGSAIAAVGPAVNASDEEMSVSIGTVFLLNALCLVLFPLLGRWFHLDEPQFGLWAALAIHDTSSVVGAGARYGPVALTVATTVKLARALWIVPLTLVTAALRGRGQGRLSLGSIQWPWFILFFLAAAVTRTLLPALAPVFPYLSGAGRLGLTVTLFLIGSGMSRASLAKVGVRPLAQGVLLWVIVAATSLALIREGTIALR